MQKKINDFYISRELLFEFLFVCFCFTVLFIWALLQPFDSCPDEKMRYVIPEYIFKHFSLPNANDTSIIDSRYGFSYASQPMLPYIISAIFMKVTSLFTTSSFALLMAARMTSILSGIGYIIFVIKTSKLAFNKISSRWIFITLCSLWPQAMFVFTYVNCDGLAMFAISIIIYFWFKIFKHGISITNAFGLSISLSIGLLSYLNVYIFAPLTVLFYICYFIRIDKSDNKWNDFFKFALIICGLVFLFSGWHFIRNMILYDGNILARGVNNYGELYGIDIYKPSVRAASAKALLATLHGNLLWIYSTSVSFIGKFGYMNISLSKISYLIYSVEIIASFISLLYLGIKHKFKIINKKYIVQFCLALSMPITLMMSYIYSFSDFQAQGRYVLPALIPLCYFLTIGFETLYDKIKHKTKNIGFLLIPFLNALVILDSLRIIFYVYA